MNNGWTPNPVQESSSPICGCGQKRIKFRQVIWYTLLVGCAVGAIYCSFMVVKGFFENSSMVQLDTQRQTEMQLPDISICSFVPLNVTLLKEGWELSDDLIEVLMWHFYQEVYVQVNASDPPITKYEGKTTKSLLRLEWDGFVSKFGVQCENIMMGCTATYTDNFECCSRMKSVLHEKYGLCHQFKNPPNISQAGVNAGLNLLLSIPDMVDYYGVETIISGAVIEYGNELSPPMTLNYHPRIFVPANKSVSVSFEMTRISRDGAFCSTGTRMTYEDCFNFQTGLRCHCLLLGFRKNLGDKTVTCGPLETKKCFDSFYPEIHENATLCSQQYEDLGPTCTEINYTPHVTYIDFRLENLPNGQELTAKKTQTKGFSEVKLYYDRLEINVIKEFNTVTFNNVVGQLGGILSLWLGLSILSISKYGAVVFHKLMNKKKRKVEPDEEQICHLCGGKINKGYSHNGKLKEASSPAPQEQRIAPAHEMNGTIDAGRNTRMVNKTIDGLENINSADKRAQKSRQVLTATLQAVQNGRLDLHGGRHYQQETALGKV